MPTTTAIGYGISHEWEGGQNSKSVLTITVKQWLGDGASSNVFHASGGSGGYGDIDVNGLTYSNAKILSQDSSYEGGQQFQTTTIEQKIDGSGGDVCFCDLTSDQIDSYSSTTSANKTKDEVSFTKSFSVQIADTESLASTPDSPSGSALLDKAISCIKSELGESSDYSSGDTDIDDVVENSNSACDTEGKYSQSRSENIDRAACSATMSVTTKKKLGSDDCCVTSRTVSKSWNQDGLMSISISGDIKGQCQDFDCSDGEKTGISKSQFEYADECFEDINIRQELEDEYEGHKQEACEDDVCLALRVQSISTTKCEEAGTISYSGSASEEEAGEKEDGATTDTEDQTTVNGCISSMTRTFNISAPVDQEFIKQNPDYLVGDCEDALSGGSDAETAMGLVEAAMGTLDIDAPDGFFGPLSLSYSSNPSQATINGSTSYSNDPQYDVDPEGLIKKKVVTTTVCTKRTDRKKYGIPCGAAVYQSIIQGPGFTKECIDVDMFDCASIAEVQAEIEQTIPAGAVVVEDTFSYSLQDGSKTGNSCIKYHTKEDLEECE
jgi:hypothetical protein